jgi:iron-sulfur cluster repair protein YtfE (RIC family)
LHYWNTTESQQTPLDNQKLPQELREEIEQFTATVEELIDVEENIDFFMIHLTEHRDPRGIIHLALLIVHRWRNHLLDVLAYLTPWVTLIMERTDAMNTSTQQPWWRTINRTSLEDYSKLMHRLPEKSKKSENYEPL